MQTHDLIVIGGGAGAFATAIRANELGANTALVNAGLPLGGTCVNVGCVPSKTLLRAAETVHQAKHHGIPGIELRVEKFDFQKVIRDELSLVETLRREKYENVLQQLEHVTPITGRATFVAPHDVAVNGETLRAEHCIIAVGSTATEPMIDGIHDTGFLTHIEALRLEKQPRELVVIGAGPLGLEFGQMFSRFGTQVTILQRGPSLFPHGEKVLTDRLEDVLRKEGITIRTNVTVQSARSEGAKKVIRFAVDGNNEEVAADVVLLAAGKTPNTGGLGLGKAGVATDAKKAVVVNKYFQTSAPHIFAVGDVTNGPLRLEPTAGREGTLAAENALTGATRSIDYATVPYAIFTDPELAGVGLTEEEQMRQMGSCTCRTVSFEHVPRARIMRRTEGLIKMAIHPTTRQILGVHILAPHAGELIAEAMTLIKNKNTIDDVVDSLPMFPTLSEAIKLVALSFTKDLHTLSCCL